jgi:hypothetical protein
MDIAVASADDDKIPAQWSSTCALQCREGALERLLQSTFGGGMARLDQHQSMISIEDVERDGMQAFARLRNRQHLQVPPCNARETLGSSTRTADRPMLSKKSSQRAVTVTSIAERPQQRSAAVVAVIERVNERQGDPVIAQIAIQRLSELVSVPGILQYIGDDLKCHTEGFTVST